MRTPILWLTTIIVTPLIYVALFIIWITVMTYYPSRDFDKEKWAQNSSTRYEYVEDLVDSEKLIGLSKQEVKVLLGEPEYETDDSISYDLGISAFLEIDPDYLEIEFKDGKAYKVEVYPG